MKLFPDTIFLLFLSAVFILTSCERSTSPLLPASLHFSAEYVAVTEADLRLQTDKLPENAALEIRRGDSLIFRGALQTADTTVTDTALLPAHDYSYTATLFKNGKPAAYSQPMQITTMDTTSHDFTWEITEFPSPYGSGELRDVCIVNENNIWAVGEIYSDSVQSWLPYNAVHWDGQQWELKRIYFPTICGQSSLTPYPSKTIFSFNNGEIWISSSGDKIAILKNGNQISNFCLPTSVSMSINKIWGTSGNDLYVVGSSGLIAHYDGAQWHRIESPEGAGGTDLPVQDIWGSKNEKTGEYEILCVASRLDQNKGRELLRINNQSVEKLQTEGLSWSLKAIWFIPGVIYYIGGDGLYPSRNLADRWHRIPSPFLYKHAIRGQAVNDVIVAGSFGLLSHFNGASWRHYNGGHFPSTGAAYRGVAIYNNIIAAVGYYNLRNGFVVVGRRN